MGMAEAIAFLFCEAVRDVRSAFFVSNAPKFRLSERAGK
jgi:hypothetical protein